MDYYAKYSSSDDLNQACDLVTKIPLVTLQNIPMFQVQPFKLPSTLSLIIKV